MLTAAPIDAEFPVMMPFVSVTTTPPAILRPAPEVAFPPVMVRPLKLTCPDTLMFKMRKFTAAAGERLIVNRCAPLPVIVRLLLMRSCWKVSESVMICGASNKGEAN